MQEVVITGMGTVTPFGVGLDRLWEAVRDGERAVSPIQDFDTDETNLSAKLAFEASEVDPESHNHIKPRKMGRHTQLAMLGADEALDDAAIDPESNSWDGELTGTHIGSGFGGVKTFDSELRQTEYGERPSLYFLLNCLPNLPAGYISIAYNAEGPNKGPGTASAAGLHAIDSGVIEIQQGIADAMIVGGTESPVSRFGVGMFEANGLYSDATTTDEAPVPFDNSDNGMLLGEATGILFIESREHAEERNADVYATIAGGGRTIGTSAEFTPQEDGEELTQAITTALGEADADPADVDLVVSAADGSAAVDAHERNAIERVFDDLPAVTAPAESVGQTLGASGSVGAVVGTKAIHTNTLPSVVMGEHDDDVETVVVTASGYGGVYGALVIEQ